MKRLLIGVAITLAGCIFGGKERKNIDGDMNSELPDMVADIADGTADAGDDSSVATCGDQTVGPDETCDPGIPRGSEGACPEVCDDGVACTADRLDGAAATCDAACVAEPIEVCMSGDGCCPSGCSMADDADCAAADVCGDGVVTGGETCDAAITAPDDGGCPDDPADCPTMSCRAARVAGTAASCSALCEYTDIVACEVESDGCCPAGCNANDDPDCASVCPNGVTEPPELCDGDCPASCDDGEACTTDVQTGTAATCDVMCINRPITTCADGDGCCPSMAGCNALNDDDCAPVCPNGVTEPPETCDGSCPSCDDGDSCTSDTMVGSAATCDVLCANTTISACVDNDGCCPATCTSANDGDCSASCGNNVTEPPETCDGDCPDDDDCTSMGACFVLTGSAGSCTAQCAVQAGCVACDPAATCTCQAGEECVGGRCAPGTGDCSLACDETAYCGIWGGNGWVCDTANDTCVSCLPTGSAESSCTDGVDDDCDGYVDCADADCPASTCGHILALTVNAYVGDMGGRAGANSRCSAQAQAYGFDPDHNWKAVLSAGGQSASMAISTSGPVVRVDGTLLTNGALWGSLNAKVQKFDGTTFTAHTPVWTGSTSAGATALTHCQSWTTTATLQFGGIGNANVMTTGWLDASCSGNPEPVNCNRCDRGNQLYCINRQ